MDFLKRIFGRSDAPERTIDAGARAARSGAGPRSQPDATPDEQAIERYRYLLRTATPETIEEAHAEAFAQLTPEQRRMVLQELSTELPAHEREAGVAYDDDPRALARMATRAEMRQPGTLERTFSRMPAGAGLGFGGIMASSLFGSFAGIMLGSAVANQFFDDSGSDQGADGGDAADSGADTSDADADTFDTGAGDAGDAGGDFGDFGGGDFGGGDFGGGDFGGEF